jgi:hypothetical protein
MEITKEYLETKKAELESGMHMATANYNANKGAVQLIDILLAELSKSEQPEVKP